MLIFLYNNTTGGAAFSRNSGFLFASLQPKLRQTKAG